MKIRFQLLITFLLLFVNFSCVGKSGKVGNSLLKIKRIDNIVPAWAGHPAGFDIVVVNNKQFIAFYDPYRQLTLGVRTISSTNWLFVKLNEFVHPTDSHNYINMAIDRDGCIHLSANMHVGHLNYWRTTNSYDISSCVRLNKMTGVQEERCTYPIFFKDSSGNLLFKYRHGQSGSGNEIINIYNEKTRTWSRFNKKSVNTNIKNKESKRDLPLLDGGGAMNAYQAGPVKGSDGYYHLAWVWRDTPDCRSNHDVQYARSTDMKHWEDSYGTAFKLPLTITNSETVDSVKIYGGMLNSLKIGFDSQKRCILKYFKFDKDGNTQIYAARREATGWKIYQITDWTNRWDFHGGGSIDSMIGNGGINYNPRYGLVCFFKNRFLYKNIAYAYILDETTMLPKYAPICRSPDFTSYIHSDISNMQVNLSGCGSYFLNWETFPNARDKGFASEVPTNLMLRMLKLEWEKFSKINKKPYKPVSDINSSYKCFFSKFNFKRDNSSILKSAKTNATKGNYKQAVADLRRFFALKPCSVDTNIDDALVVQYKNHTFNFKIDGKSIKRTLLFNIDTWHATAENKEYILTNWSVVNHLSMKTRQINSNELSKIQPFELIMPKWYYELNRLPHLIYFAKEYAKNHNHLFARMYIHDLEDWFCDNPVPPSPTALPGSWYITLTSERLDELTDYISFFAVSKDVSDLEFFYLMNTIQKHKDYLKSCLKSDQFDRAEKRGAYEALHSESLTLKIK